MEASQINDLVVSLIKTVRRNIELKKLRGIHFTNIETKVQVALDLLDMKIFSQSFIFDKYIKGDSEAERIWQNAGGNNSIIDKK